MGESAERWGQGERACVCGRKSEGVCDVCGQKSEVCVICVAERVRGCVIGLCESLWVREEGEKEATRKGRSTRVKERGRKGGREG